MARILIGNIKGPAGKIVSVSATKGEPGTDPQVTNVGTESDAKLQFVIPEGQKGEQGLQGPTGPMPPLVNNLTTNQAGQGALDAAQGKALADKDTALQSAVDTLNRKSKVIVGEVNSYGNINPSLGNTAIIESVYSDNNGVQLVPIHSGNAWFIMCLKNIPGSAPTYVDEGTEITATIIYSGE